ncbi:MAG: DUF1097 domain-containing protein, partial [Alphaproteobacteria bacterium]
MTSLVALSISIGVLGAVAAWLALGPLSAYLAIWIIFIGWATYFATGGDTAGLKTTIVSGIWGAICAWVALMILKTFPLDLGQAVWPAIVVGATVLVLCLGAHVEALKNIPASVYGYAATAAVALTSASADVTAANFSNPLIFAVVSIIVGA